MYETFKIVLAFVRQRLYVGVAAVVVLLGYVAWQAKAEVNATQERLTRLEVQYTTFSTIVGDYFRARATASAMGRAFPAVAPMLPTAAVIDGALTERTAHALNARADGDRSATAK